MNPRAIARVMRPNRHTLDEDSATRMLQGIVHPDDAPPGYGSVASLLASAAHLRAADEDAGAATVSAMVETIRDATSTPQTHRRKSMVGKLFAGKALAAVAATVALTASGAAAATGSLPDPVQNAVAGAVSHVGVDIPAPGDQGKSAAHRQDGAHRPGADPGQSGDDHGQSGDDHGQSGDDHGQSGDDHGQSGDDHGQSGDDHGQSGSSGDHGQGSPISTIAHDPALAGQPKGATVCAAASDGQCHAGDDTHGKGSDEGTTTTTAGTGDDQGGGHAGDDHGRDQATPPTTPTTGSLATGEDHSGRDLPSSGKGGSGSN